MQRVTLYRVALFTIAAALVTAGTSLKAGSPGPSDLPVVLVGSDGSDSVLAFEPVSGSYIGRIVVGIGYPNGMAARNGTAYIASVLDSSIRPVDLETGAPGVPIAGGGLLNPDAVLLVGDELVVSSYSTSSVKGYNLQTGVWRDVIPPGASGLSGAAGLALRGNTLYVSSQLNDRIIAYSFLTGTYLLDIGVECGLDTPGPLLVDSSNNILVANLGSSQIMRFTINGACVGTIGLDGVNAITWAPNGNLLVTSRTTNRVHEIAYPLPMAPRPFELTADLAAPTHIATAVVNDFDCNANGIPDTWDVEFRVARDCNNNSVPDSCDIASGASVDANGDGRPDECPPLGDLACDGALSVSDIGAFVLALTDPAGYAAQYPGCDIDNADMNQDGVVSVSDIALFVAELTGA